MVFVWTCRGRAEVLGMLLFPSGDRPAQALPRVSSLSLSVLDVSRPAPQHLDARGPGHRADPIDGAPPPPRVLRNDWPRCAALTHEFSASTRDDKERHWELRLLASAALPLREHRSRTSLDGALFAFVTSAGTDPEALLVLEARKPASDRPAVWHYAVARFTDLNLWVRHKGK